MRHLHLLMFFFLCALHSCTAQKMRNPEYSEYKVYRNLKKAVSNKDDVKVLFLNDKGLEEFPEEVLELKNLRVLNLMDNNIEAIPMDIDQLSNLEQLILMKNNLKNLPRTLANLKKLKVLNLSYNGFSDNDVAFLRKSLPECRVIVFLEL